jgi:heme exporter protein D
LIPFVLRWIAFFREITMQEKSSDETKSSYQYSFSIAVILTVLIIVFAVLIWTGVLHIPASPYESRDEQGHIGFSITDFGTYVAGVFTSLSFIWLVVNALQQREDLKLQREEMRENNEHQRRQAKQLKKAAKLSLQNSKIQKEIFVDEKIKIYLKKIHNFLIINHTQMNIKIPDQENSDVFAKFSSYAVGDCSINLFGKNSELIDTKGKILEYEMQMEFRLINSLDRFCENCEHLYTFIKENEIILDINNTVIEKYRAVNYFYEEMDKLILMLDESYRKPLTTAYRIDKLQKAFAILQVIFYASETKQILK